MCLCENGESGKEERQLKRTDGDFREGEKRKEGGGGEREKNSRRRGRCYEWTGKAWLDTPQIF